MAKYKTSSLIGEIRGSIGDKTFCHWHGIPVIRKKIQNGNGSNSVAITKTREIFRFLNNRWTLISFKEQELWEFYAKRNRRIKSKKLSGLMCAIGNWYTGKIAFMSVNQLLMMSGFPPLQKPLLGRSQPPLPVTNLPEYSEWVKEIRFKIWLPVEYKDRCVVQVWIQKLSLPRGWPYIMKVVPVSTSPTEIKIERIKFQERRNEGRKSAEKGLSEIGYCKMLLQMRTVAENGRFSVPSSIYKIELGRKPLSSCSELLSKYCISP